ncbi:MAG: DUF4390 domain-containing protein [Telluria sp.]
MTLRPLRSLALRALLLLTCTLALAADIDISRVTIDATEDGYRIATNYNFELTHGLEDVIQKGVPLFFTTDVQVIHPRWWWRDEVVVDVHRTAKIRYDVLTREYSVQFPDSIPRKSSTLDDALFSIRRQSWILAPRSALKPGETYTVIIKMGMDREYLSKPIQVNAFNNAEWRLNSNVRRFTYRAE